MPSTRDPETRFGLFVGRVDQAWNRRAVQEETLRANWVLTASPEQSTLHVDHGDEEDVRSLLIDFRSFVAPQEPVFANWVFNELERCLTDEDLRANARFNREQWELAKRGPAATVVNGTTYTAEMAFDLIVNGALFHTDEDKAARWEMLPPFMQALMRNSMHDFVIDGLNVLYPTRNLVTEALEKGLLAFS